MNLRRALNYLLGLRFWHDLRSLLRHWLQPAPDILFVAGSQVDLQWVIPVYDAAVARGLRCVYAGPGLTVPSAAPYVDITVHLLRFTRSRITITATSGLKPGHMPRSERWVAVPHSLVSLHMVYPAGTFDGYTDVFCCGVHHFAEIEAMNQLNGQPRRRPVLIGYGKLERLAATRPATPAAMDAPRHVLIGPSWGAGNILETMGRALLARLLDDGWHVTLRPHPSFFIYGDEQIAPLVESFREHPAFTLEDSTEESRALWSADMMIADYSGFAMEFAFIRERPVLYVNVPPKVLNPSWRAMGLTPLELSVRERIGGLVAPTVDDVVAGLERLARDAAQWSGRIRQEREGVWVNFGRFGEVCADELVCMLADQDKRER